MFWSKNNSCTGTAAVSSIEVVPFPSTLAEESRLEEAEEPEDFAARKIQGIKKEKAELEARNEDLELQIQELLRQLQEAGAVS
jgi:hypothetical protein